jgi:hypothetical protein
MKTMIAFCLPMLVYGQSFLVSQSTSFSIEYAPIALIRLQSSSNIATAEVPAEAGECLLNTPLKAGTAQLFMSVSRHNPKEVRARIAADQPLNIECEIVQTAVNFGTYQTNGVVGLSPVDQTILHMPEGICTGLVQGVPVGMKILKGDDYGTVQAGSYSFNIQYHLL